MERWALDDWRTVDGLWSDRAGYAPESRGVVSELVVRDGAGRGSARYGRCSWVGDCPRAPQLTVTRWREGEGRV